MSDKKDNRPPSALKNFIAGGAGGICLVITGQPLDTIKVCRRTNVAKLPITKDTKKISKHFN